MIKKKPKILIDPYPRTVDLIFSKKNLKYLETHYNLLIAPNNIKSKKNFYINEIINTEYIIGQPELDKKLLDNAKKLKAIFNVEGNFMQNLDYKTCFTNGIHVLSTSPVFTQPVAEMAMGLLLSIARSIHIAHSDFINNKEKYGSEKSEKNFLIKNKIFGIIGYGDLAKKLVPILKSFSQHIYAFDPWVPNKIMEEDKVKKIELNKLLKSCNVIFVLASVTSSNKEMLNYKNLNFIKNNSVILLLSRAAVINFEDLYNFLKKRDVFACIDVFPKEPFPKNHKIRKLKNIIFSPHRAGALDETFKQMGEILIEDLKLLDKNLPPRVCKRAELETVNRLESMPVKKN